MPASHNLLIKLTINGIPIEGSVNLPQGRAPARALLPALAGITDTIVKLATMQAHDRGQTISCQKGCDACCRQMVPIAPAEAFALAAHLDSLPPALAAPVLERFDSALETLAEKGLLAGLKNRGTLSAPELYALDRAYFAAQVPCPFLENRACSIHALRPLVCREYLVTSPSHHCAQPREDHVRLVPLDARPSQILRKNDRDWLPLVLAREYLARHREPHVADAQRTLVRMLQKL